MVTPMDTTAFARISPTTFADVLTRDRIMDHGIRPLWSPVPRVAGPAYPVACEAGDNLMLHAAIHRAPAGAVIVVSAHDCDWAMAGGNVCAWAQRRGIAAFVIDGVIRDVGEVRERQFPVFARGVIPIPGGRLGPGLLNAPVTCGGVRVAPGDVVVADEEGIVVIAAAKAEETLRAAEDKAARDARQSLDEWARQHRERIDAILREKGLGSQD
jgi:regulator of RNase E activity RraA